MRNYSQKAWSCNRVKNDAMLIENYLMSGGRRFDSKKYKDLREFKSKEIKRSLTHKANLKKNYLKLLEKENLNNDSNDNDNETNETKPEKPAVHEERRQLTFNERSQLVKQRKEEKRKRIFDQVKERKQKIEKSNRDRERKKAQLSKTNKYGQPLMGPRINNLLDKIKKDAEN